MNKTVRVAAAQMTSVNDLMTKFATCSRLVQVLLVPSTFTKVTGEAHWEVLLRARAIETQCYVIVAAQAGKHSEKRESYGDTLIIDPWGTVCGWKITR